MNIRIIHSPDYRTLGRSMYDFGYVLGRITRFGCLAFAGYICGSFVRALIDVFFR